MRLAPVLLATLAVAACHDESTLGPVPTAPGDTLRIVGGPLTCDWCPTARFSITGPGFGDVASARFIAHDDPDGDPLSADIELRRSTGDSGATLEATARFTGPVAAGVYDLWLTTPQRNLPLQRLVIGQALRVTRTWPSPTRPDTAAPPTSGPPTPPVAPPPSTPTTTGTLRVTVTVVGDDRDQEFTASVDEDYNGPVALVSPLAPAEFTLRTGAHYVSLYGLAENCASNGGPFRQVTVGDGTTVEVSFVITCSKLAYIRVELVLGGTPPFGDPRYPSGLALCDERLVCGSFTDARRSLLISTTGGQHTFTLAVRPYCRAAVALPLTVSAIPGDTVRAEFPVTCDPHEGTLTVRLRTTGTGVAGSFGVLYGIDGCSNDWYSDVECASATLTEAGPLTVTLLSGPVIVQLTGGSATCRLTSPNPIRGELPGGGTLEVVFDVECD